MNVVERRFDVLADILNDDPCTGLRPGGRALDPAGPGGGFHRRPDDDEPELRPRRQAGTAHAKYTQVVLTQALRIYSTTRAINNIPTRIAAPPATCERTRACGRDERAAAAAIISRLAAATPSASAISRLTRKSCADGSSPGDYSSGPSTSPKGCYRAGVADNRRLPADNCEEVG